MTERNCKQCKKPFLSHRPRHKFCRKGCATRFWLSDPIKRRSLAKKISAALIGRQRSEKEKQAISLGHRGKVLSLKTRLRIKRSVLRGLGQTRKKRQTRRTSARYLSWRRRVLRRDGNKCRQCFSTKQLEAHHLKPWSLFPKSRYVIKNGLTLCKKCHLLIT